MAEKIYFHALTPEERKGILESHMTAGEFMEKYSQPEWCNYPEALTPIMGCWSLVSDHITVNNESCKTCDLYNKERI